MTPIYRTDLIGVDWVALKTTLRSDQFDNGRTADQLQRSFQNSYGVCIAWADDLVVGTGRVLSDGVGNAYMIDVWTLSRFRRQGIATRMIGSLCSNLSGQHVYLQADGEAQTLYRRLDFSEQPVGMGRVIGRYLQG